MESFSRDNPFTVSIHDFQWIRMSHDFLFSICPGRYTILRIVELVEGIISEIDSIIRNFVGGDVIDLGKVLPKAELHSVLVNHKNQILFSYAQNGLQQVLLISFSPRMKS